MGVRGELQLCRAPGTGDATDGGSTGDRSRLTSVFVNGPGARPLEDNDIRGFLDGRFMWGWNQSGQTKVRLGRNRAHIRPPKYGEDELFRVLQRWSGLDLPRGATVRQARLRLHATGPLAEERRVYLYAALRDWNPGRGGVRRDNVSVPEEGEVWWGEARRGREAWGLPGAGYASDDDPDADTDVQPLARARCPAGSREVELGDERLTRHVDEVLGGGRPLLFLLKLSDREEDQPGSLLGLRSGEFGVDADWRVRPRLELEWEPPSDASCSRADVFLEHGRERTIGPIVLHGDQRLWTAFECESGFEPPTLQWREVARQDGSAASDWRPVDGHGPVSPDLGAIEVRILAARNPVALGEEYSARLRDTWVVSAPPEDQDVEWRFVAPSGAEHRVTGDYRGDFTWRVAFVPDEIGRWRVRWRHELAGPEEVGPAGTFDVGPGGADNAMEQIGELTERAAELPRTGEGKERELARFLPLERGVMQDLTAEEFRADRGRALRRALDRAREVLWGRPMPAEIPMESHELRRRVGGRRLSEPIPRYDRHFRDEASGPTSGTVAAWIEEAASWCRRAARRLKRAMLGDGRRESRYGNGGAGGGAS